MASDRKQTTFELQQHYQMVLAHRVSSAPWVLRITDLKDKPSPVLIIKERYSPELPSENTERPSRKTLRERGLIYGQSLRRCLPAIRTVVAEVADTGGIPLGIPEYLPDRAITFRGNLPLNKAAGSKLALLFKLQERVNDQNRVELIAWRVERFTSEEAAYWLTRATQYGTAGNRWAQAGMRIMLGGQPGDPAIRGMLEKLRR